MFINLSNHPSSNWEGEQIEQSRIYGTILDLPFPEINPEWSEKEFQREVEIYYQWIMHMEHPVVLLQGEHVFCFRLAKKLLASGIPVVAAMSRRISCEHRDGLGNIVKTSTFRFEGYRKY